MYVEVRKSKDRVYPDSKVYGANMGPTWGRQDPGGPKIGPMNLAIYSKSNQQLEIPKVNLKAIYEVKIKIGVIWL